MDAWNLQRFVEAQAQVIDSVQRELASGHKRTHWMWFVFPQLRGLGRSPTAQFYGLDGLEEGRAYLAHPVLGPRLLECTALVNKVEGKSALQIFGSPDDLKFRSSMTLFSRLQPAPFDEALQRYFGGEPDALTLELLHAA